MSSSQSKIEDFAFDYLQNYYTVQQGAKNILISRSEKAKNGTEANGLFVFKDRNASLFLASVSFKNTDNLANLLTHHKQNGLSKLRFVTPALLFTVSILAIRNLELGIYAWALPIIFAALGYILHSLVENFYIRRKVKKMVDELKSHEANEKWLGLSISSLSFRNNSLASYLLKICQRKGIGLITVGKRSKVVLMQEPRTLICKRGDFLSYYQEEENIRKSLEKDTVLRVA